MSPRRRRKPPLVIEGCGIEHYAFRPRTIAFAGHGLLFRGNREVGPVPCLAIGRERNGELRLLHCDSRWNVRGGMTGYKTIREVKARAERFYPGISTSWRKTGYSRSEIRRRLREGPTCSICSKAWYEVDRMIGIPKARLHVCDTCVMDLYRLMSPRHAR